MAGRLLKALPRSGGWLDSVKVVMGFLELAAALKFFRTAELRLLPTPAYFTYDLVLAGWVAIAVAWLLAQRIVAAPIVNASAPCHVDELVQGVGTRLGRSHLADIARAVV